jgi:glycosyltransferase involved in cell wall biosynthesis
MFIHQLKYTEINLEELEGDKFKPLFDMCKNTKNVNYIGYGTNEEIRKALETTDILAYPSIFEETSCIAAIEAMMAGCHVVTNELRSVARNLL